MASSSEPESAPLSVIVQSSSTTRVRELSGSRERERGAWSRCRTEEEKNSALLYLRRFLSFSKATKRETQLRTDNMPRREEEDEDDDSFIVPSDSDQDSFVVPDESDDSSEESSEEEQQQGGGSSSSSESGEEERRHDFDPPESMFASAKKASEKSNNQRQSLSAQRTSVRVDSRISRL